jgi:DNA-binding NtrC family response regulator
MVHSAPRPRVVVVSGDAALRHELASALRVDFEVFEAQDAEGGVPLLEENLPELLLWNLETGPAAMKEVLAFLTALRESDLDTLVVVLSRDARKSTALRLMESGAYDYFVHPLDLDVLRPIIDRAVEKLRTERDNRILRDHLRRRDSLGEMIGGSEPMRSVFDLIRKIAVSPTTVCIRGESGTGKELVARAIHDLSDRRAHPFISVNCAALPETLMESELFGYEKGAFTGAVGTKEGRIELAHRGTLFLDEIGTLTPTLQSKLLRILEEHTLVRLGGKKTIRVDFRLLTATNEDLEELVRENRFREDLYYRIHVVPVFLPPLRERGEDIGLLVDYFVRVYCAANHTPLKPVTDEAIQTLKRYAWPGNVRELENAIQRIVLMTEGEAITQKDIPGDILRAAGQDHRGRFRLPASGFDLQEAVEGYEKSWVEAALSQAGGVRAQAAKLLGVNKDKLKYLCRKHDL